MEKKYKLTDETIQHRGITLYRIEALRDFGNIKKGEKGGFIGSEVNLSQYGDCWVYGNANVCGDAEVCDNAEVCGDAEVVNNADYIVFKNWWSSGRYFTWTKSNNMWRVGCFYGTGKQLIAKAYKDSELSGREYERIVRYVEAINIPIKKLNRIQKIVCKLFNIK